MAATGIRSRILVVDDARDTLEVLERNLTSRGYIVFTAASAAEAINILDQTPVNLVITDLKMPEVSGLELLTHVRNHFKETMVMIITGFATIEGAVEAVKVGAEEYLPKPFTDEELFEAVERVLAKLRLRSAVQEGAEGLPPGSYGIYSRSESMKRVFREIAKASSTLATVLISGESGSGKELVARAIHYSSSRASAPFVPVNCGGIPEGLLESELFGHMKGSFTGATESRAGFFQTADGGSIFLDEVSETSLAMQVKLLRVLEDRQVHMVGATRPRDVDVRVLAATNRDLYGLVQKGVFREDLFFRLNVIGIAIPPLRERDDDVLLLADLFAKKFAKEFEKPVPRFSDSALQALLDYHWPGNVRELENVVQRLVLMTEGETIEAADLPSVMRFNALHGSGLTRTLAEVEAEYIRNVLAAVGGNKTKAARILGIDRKTLREKLSRFAPDGFHSRENR